MVTFELEKVLDRMHITNSVLFSKTILPFLSRKPAKLQKVITHLEAETMFWYLIYSSNYKICLGLFPKGWTFISVCP